MSDLSESEMFLAVFMSNETAVILDLIGVKAGWTAQQTGAHVIRTVCREWDRRRMAMARRGHTGTPAGNAAEIDELDHWAAVLMLFLPASAVDLVGDDQRKSGISTKEEMP